MRCTEPHLDEVDALDEVLDFLDQLHLVHRFCLCQADGEMRLFFWFGDVFCCCLGDGGREEVGGEMGKDGVKQADSLLGHHVL